METLGHLAGSDGREDEVRRDDDATTRGDEDGVDSGPRRRRERRGTGRTSRTRRTRSTRTTRAMTRTRRTTTTDDTTRRRKRGRVARGTRSTDPPRPQSSIGGQQTVTVLLEGLRARSARHRGPEHRRRVEPAHPRERAGRRRRRSCHGAGTAWRPAGGRWPLGDIDDAAPEAMRTGGHTPRVHKRARKYVYTQARTHVCAHVCEQNTCADWCGQLTKTYSNTNTKYANKQQQQPNNTCNSLHNTYEIPRFKNAPNKKATKHLQQT